MTVVTKAMEKRAVAPLVLGGAGLVLAVAIGVLVVKVRAGAPAAAESTPEQSRATGRVSVPAERVQEATPSPPPPRPEPPGEPEKAAEPPAENPAATIAEQMVEANRLYDRGDYEAASRAAEEILVKDPANVKMLRIATSSACILGDADKARPHYDKLPASDQEQIARRCRRYGVEF